MHSFKYLIVLSLFLTLQLQAADEFKYGLAQDASGQIIGKTNRYRFIGSLETVSEELPSITLTSEAGTNIITSTNFTVNSLTLRNFTNQNRLLIQTSTGEIGTSPVKVTGSEPDSLVTWQLLTNLVPLLQTTGGTNILRASLPVVTNLHFNPIVLNFRDTNLNWINWDMTATNTISLLLTNPYAGASKLVRLTGNTNLLTPVDCTVSFIAQAGLGMEWPVVGGVPVTNSTLSSNTATVYEFRCWNTNLVTVNYTTHNLDYKGRGHEPPGSSSLLTGLAAYWNLDEASGDRVDLVAGLTLTNAGNATLGYAGLVTNAAFFGNLGYSNILIASADTTATEFGNSDWTISCWINPTNLVGVSRHIVSKGVHLDGSTTEADLYMQDDDIVVAVLAQPGDVLKRLYGPSISTNTWYHVVTWWNSSTHYLYLKVNDGITYSLNVGAEIRPAAIGRFTVGGWYYQMQAAYNFNGYVDEVGKWSRILTADEIQTLYNAGTGVTYPFDIP